MSRLARRTQFLVAITVFVLAAPIAGAQRICTIPDAKMADAQAIFAKITAVLRQPRCINCHGGQNPFTADTQHEGGTYDVIKDPSGFVLEDKTFVACQTCHGDLKGWQMAPDDMSFVGKDDPALCKLLKFQLRNGENVIDHFTNDRGGTPFIEVAFKGTRGLDEQGRALVNNYRPEPIQGATQSDLISWGRQWLTDLGSVEGPIGGDGHTDCGCVKHHYALQVHSRATIDMQGIHYDAGFASEPLVPIIFDEGGRTFHSETTTVGQAGVLGGTCSGQGGASVALSAKGTLIDGPSTDKYGNPIQIMKVTINAESSGISASVSCPKGSMSVGGLSGPGSADFELPALVDGKSKEFPALPGVPGGGGTFWVKIVQVD